ncbi:MAG: TIGR03757 family integrating conjugative element protein [Pseudomonadales bacterium]|nr:TIGR03757 family integrating conjugative element protein [Pseudomonadales bacterium]MCP5191435.1 TIGR03757 family integrating conjugative element protein [Pseudomonadales bacterium]
MVTFSKPSRVGRSSVNVAKAQYIISLLLTGTLCASVQASEIAIEQTIEQAPTIEVFTDSSLQIVSGNDHTTVYLIDRIYKLQEELSIELPADSGSAKILALQRFQQLDNQLSTELENAAKGLVQAMQYGIDRYPAIVFDGQAVVYGLTDIYAASQLYQRWQAESAEQ